VDLLCEALGVIVRGGYRDGYVLDKERGEYTRSDFEDGFESRLDF
jgi:hypothetical protein